MITITQATTAADAEHWGLTSKEFTTIVSLLSRPPTQLELGLFSAMWSEHCSYKSSRSLLRLLPTQGPQVVVGPGQNAGVIDVGDDTHLVAFKIESHNHPSFIEPYNGAATGVGGILRDIFAMGAQPIASLNFIATGPPDVPANARLLRGIVDGIGGYGNAIGIPTIGGQVTFHTAFNQNVLVNAMAVGLVDRQRVLTNQASGHGNILVYLGQRTGRDGIHGASMASDSFDDDALTHLPTVQVGDPYSGRRLMDALEQIWSEELAVATQDMGAAGLTSSAVEMGAQGGMHVHLQLDRVPLRAQGMTPLEMMLSETQERMLLLVRPDQLTRVLAIARTHSLPCAAIGQIEKPEPNDRQPYLRLNWHETVLTELPLTHLIESVPTVDPPQPTHPSPPPAETPAHTIPDEPDDSPLVLVQRLLGSAHLASRRWVWKQFDALVGGRTVLGTGFDAAVMSLRPLSPLNDNPRGIAVTLDANPRWIHRDPYTGTALLVCECVRNLACVGAKALALTDNLNFGNPRHLDVMHQLTESVRGLGDAARALSTPVVSGNVSLFNTTDDTNIPPTPVIGAVGSVKDVGVPGKLCGHTGDQVWLLGPDGQNLGGSCLEALCGLQKTALPSTDFPAEQRLAETLCTALTSRWVHYAHDISDGGALACLAEICILLNLGADLVWPGAVSVPTLFAEDPGRCIVVCPPQIELHNRLALIDENLPVRRLGVLGGDQFSLAPIGTIPLQHLASSAEHWLSDQLHQSHRSIRPQR